MDKAVKDMEAKLYRILIFEMNVSVAKKIPSGEEQKIEDKMKPSLVTLSSVGQRYLKKLLGRL